MHIKCYFDSVSIHLPPACNTIIHCICSTLFKSQFFALYLKYVCLVSLPPAAFANTAIMTNTFPVQKTSPIARLRSVDVLRGAVMLLMAIDHVRVYSGVPAGSPNPSIFFTRWVTHFCVPAFVFLAGTSAFLYKQQLKDPPAISRFLVTRGFFLVLLELTVIRFFWTFNLHYSQFTLAGVIWMLGWCMVLMAALVKLPVKTIGIIGVLLVIFQQVFHYIPMIFSKPVQESLSYVWNFFYPTGLDGWDKISILYVIIPWIGVMAAGYAFGTIMMMEAAKRRKFCLSIGILFILLFIIAGSLVAWFGPAHQNDMPFLFRLLGQQKYPPSQLYLLMTLGPLIALVPFAEKLRGWFAEVLTVFGKVPLFYYLLHILLIHIAGLTVNFLREGNIHQDWYDTAPYAQVPEDHRWGLPLLYLVFVMVEVVLYFACRSYAIYKAAHPEKKWLKYV